jgi:hypothetical protein
MSLSKSIIANPTTKEDKKKRDDDEDEPTQIDEDFIDQ